MTTRKIHSQAFPLSLRTHVTSVLFALLMAIIVYSGVSLYLHGNLRQAIEQAHVTCEFLESLPGSSIQACNERKIIPLKNDVKGLKEPSPNDYLLLLDEADVVNREDISNPSYILDLNRKQESWITTGLIETKLSGIGVPLSKLLLTPTTIVTEEQASKFEQYSKLKESCPEIVHANNREVYMWVSTVVTINQYLMSMAGDADPGVIGDGDPDARRLHDSKCPMPARLFNRSMMMADLIAGPHNIFLIRAPKVESSQKIIKDMMTTAGLYSIKPQGDSEETDAESKTFNLTLNPWEWSYNVQTEREYRSSQQSTKSIRETVWFPKNPALLSEGINRLSTLLVNEINRDREVAKWRFLFKAWRGYIQFLLVVLFFYLIYILIWRLRAAKSRHTVPLDEPVTHIPTVMHGPMEDKEEHAFQSRRFIDIKIQTLPLVGLFGTVIGILFALPRAPGVIALKGARQELETQTLFENLGLAFSTTAIAVFSLIIIQFFWEIVQHKEDRCLERLEKDQNKQEQKHKEV